MQGDAIRRMKSFRDGSRLLAGLMILALAGCDNVDWGGMDVAVIPPPPKGAAGEDEGGQAAEMGPLPDGPVLYYVRADSTGGTIQPVAEVSGDSLIALGADADPDLYGSRFISQHLRRGSEFTLFRRGARVGTLLVGNAEVPRSAACRRLPIGRGTLELAGGTLAGPTEFLALAKQNAPEGRSTAVSSEPTIGMRRVAPILAERALRARRAQLPGNWQAAMAQLVPFPVSATREPAFASTFLVDDQLQVGNDTTGYSMFLLAVPRSDLTGYDTVHVAYSAYPRTGKRAPRVVDYLDWDRDGEAELLLQVYGTSRAWFEAVGPDDGEWSGAFQERCTEEVPSAAPPPEPGDTAQTGTTSAMILPARAAPGFPLSLGRPHA